MKRVNSLQKHLFYFFGFVFLIFLTTNVSAAFTGNISISHPIDLGAYVSNISTINYTLTSGGQSCWYSTDSGTTNSSSVSAGTAFTGLNLGTSNLTVYCNNSIGDVGQSNVSFIVGDFTSADEINKMLASDKQAGDRFGGSVSISGNYAIVGAYGEDTGGIDAGAAYIYKKNSTGQYVEVNKIMASDAQAGDLFGESVSISGDYAIVGASGEDAGGSSAGASYIFKKNSTGQYVEVNKIMASDANASDSFGQSVSISGDYAIVGAIYETTGGSAAGASYIFKKNSTGQYEEVNKIMASDAQAGDKFGKSVSISGDYAIVGASYEDTGGSNAGAAYIFKKNSTGQYEEVNKIQASDKQINDYFGWSVSISGDYAIVGASGEDAGGSSAGASYIFKKNSTGQYEEVNKIMASDAAAGDQFGYSVSISGDYVIVGANYEGTGGIYAGAAYVYKKNSTRQYEEVNKIMASDAQANDYFGQSVSISGDYAVVGAYGESNSGSNAGATYSFQMNYGTPNITLTYPVDKAAYISNISTINYTLTSGGQSCWYSTDSGTTNSSSVSAGTAFTGLNLGTSNLTVYCNNSLGNVGQSNVSFIVGNYDITNEINKFLASDANVNNYFGYSASISGDYAVVGAYGEDTGGIDAGAAYIYKKNSTGQYEEVNKIMASDAAAGDLFGNSVSISGDYVIVGAYGEATGGTNAGAAYIYKKNSTGQYEEVNKIMASDAAAGDFFGDSVTISGNYAIVGAWSEATGGSNAGAAYIFKKNSTGQYEEVNKIMASDAAAGDFFGDSVTISGNYAIVGAYGEATGGIDAGAAYIFKKNSTGQYEEVNKIMASDAQTGDNFGSSVSISGDYAIVGAYGEDTGGGYTGAAYIFKKNSTGQYEEINKIMAGDAQSNDYFGYSVSISGDYVIVGAYGEATGGSNAGAAYIFKKNSTGQYEEVNKIMAGDAQAGDNFGISVTISSDYAIIGAYDEDVGGSNAGAAYSFQMNYGTPNITLISPANVTSSTTNAYNFTFNVTDNQSISDCNLILDGSIINTLTSINNSGGTNGMYNSSLSVATHTWSVNCTNVYGKVGNSSTRTLVVSAVAATATTSSSSGSEGYPVYYPTKEQTKNGYSKSIAKNWKIKFKIENKSHELKIEELINSTVRITISSNPQTAMLIIGDLKKFELTNDSYYDLSVKLNSIKNNRANLTVQSIHEEINPKTVEEKQKDIIKDNNPNWIINKKLVSILAIIIFVIVVSIYYFYYKKHSKKRKE